MARIRTIKPEFWTDDAVTECSLSARLLFIGMWNFADDTGNLDRSAKQIKARVFPLDNIDCEPLIQELITHGLLSEYTVSDKKYLHVQGFTDHQLINRPSKPTCPAFEESLITHTVLTESSGNTHDGRERKGGKEKRKIKQKENFNPPDWIDPEKWQAFMEIREAKGAAQTARALKSIVISLADFKGKGHDPNACIEKSIRNSWKDVFEPKQDNWRSSSGVTPMHPGAGG